MQRIHTNGREALLNVTLHLQIQNFVHVMVTVLSVILKH